MVETTEGIILSLQKHTDKTSVVHIYTKKYGRMQFLLYGHGKKGKINSGILSPLSYVEITYSHQAVHTMGALQTIMIRYVSSRIQNDVRRQCIALFIAEALYKTMRLPMEDDQLFDYLVGLIKELDLSDSIENIPERFMVELSMLLGYGGEPIEELKKMKSVEMMHVMIN